jgi:hypothetical protein
MAAPAMSGVNTINARFMQPMSAPGFRSSASVRDFSCFRVLGHSKGGRLSPPGMPTFLRGEVPREQLRSSLANTPVLNRHFTAITLHPPRFCRHCRPMSECLLSGEVALYPPGDRSRTNSDHGRRLRPSGRTIARGAGAGQYSCEAGPPLNHVLKTVDRGTKIAAYLNSGRPLASH